MSIDNDTLARWAREREQANARRAERQREQDITNLGVIGAGSNFYYPTEAQVAATSQTQTATKPKVTVPAAEPPTSGVIEKCITCVPQVNLDPMTVLVVGAGGTGARVVPPLTQMLRRRDRLFIMDHDIVEDRNLARQHFTERDIGQPKALVLAQRYQKRDVKPIALVARLTSPGLQQAIESLDFSRSPRNQLVILGCVDNNEARNTMSTLITGSAKTTNRINAIAHIDVGNERRGGQVLLSLRGWPLVATEMGNGAMPARAYNMPTMTEAMPQLCRPVSWMCDDCAIQMPPEAKACTKCKREAGTCGNRIDLQTVMVNHMAAGMVLNCLSWLMLGIPFTSAGAFFSTLNMVQPIKIKSVDYDAGRLKLDTTFAEA